MLALTVLAAVVSAIFVLAPLYNGPRSVFSWNAVPYATWAVASGTLVFAVVVLAGRSFGFVPALTFGVLADAAMLAKIGRGVRRARRLGALCAALTGPTASSALVELDRELVRLRDAGRHSIGRTRHWARWTLHVAAHASRGGYTGHALRWAESIDEATLDRGLQIVHAQHLAAFRLSSDDRDGARRAIARVRRPAEPASFERALQALETLLEALEGDAREALMRAEKGLAVRDPDAVRISWQMAEVHALAATGAQANAQDRLRSMRVEHGPLVLGRVAAHRGPASALATALMASDVPYR